MGLFGNKYDAFISYKSKNVEIARLLADRLIASGVKVWFAEYQVLLVERERFQEAIDKGIRKCRYGIALTNDEYAESPYCEKEMVQLLEYCGPNKIMEIMIPREPKAHQVYPLLKNCPAHVFTGDIEETLRFVAQKVGWKIRPQIEGSPTRGEDIFKGNCLEEPYTIDVSGWELQEKIFHSGGPCYVRNVEGHDLFWNLQYGEEHSPVVYDARRRVNQKDERALYDNICDYANHYFRDLKSNSRVVGAHLLFKDGLSHFAVTYFDDSFWKRRYSLMLVHPETNRAAEFVFTFQFPGRFEDYCRCVELMDNLVMTLKWSDGKEDAKKIPAKKPSPKGDMLSRIIEDQPMASKFYDEGIAFAKKGRLIEAVAAWEKVKEYTTLDEMLGATFYNMGLAHEKLGDDEKAIQCYEESAKANPKQFNALCNIGNIYLRKKNPKDALKYLLEAAKRNPNDYITINNIVIACEEVGDDDQADYWRDRWRRLTPPGRSRI